MQAVGILQESIEDGPLIETGEMDSPHKIWKRCEALHRPKGLTAEFLLVHELFKARVHTVKPEDLESLFKTIRRVSNERKAKKNQRS